MKKVKSKLISLILAESFLLSSILPAWASPSDFLRPRSALSSHEVVGALQQRQNVADGGHRNTLLPREDFVRLSGSLKIPLSTPEEVENDFSRWEIHVDKENLLRLQNLHYFLSILPEQHRSRLKAIESKKTLPFTLGEGGDADVKTGIVRFTFKEELLEPEIGVHELAHLLEPLLNEEEKSLFRISSTFQTLRAAFALSAAAPSFAALILMLTGSLDYKFLRGFFIGSIGFSFGVFAYAGFPHLLGEFFKLSGWEPAFIRNTVSVYSLRSLFENFAETYTAYVFLGDEFRADAKENPHLRKIYETLKRRFNGVEYTKRADGLIIRMIQGNDATVSNGTQEAGDGGENKEGFPGLWLGRTAPTMDQAVAAIATTSEIRLPFVKHYPAIAQLVRGFLEEHQKSPTIDGLEGLEVRILQSLDRVFVIQPKEGAIATPGIVIKEDVFLGSFIEPSGDILLVKELLDEMESNPDKLDLEQLQKAQLNYLIFSILFGFKDVDTQRLRTIKRDLSFHTLRAFLRRAFLVYQEGFRVDVSTEDRGETPLTPARATHVVLLTQAAEEDHALIFLKGGKWGGLRPTVKRRILKLLSPYYEMTEGTSHRLSYSTIIGRWGDDLWRRLVFRRAIRRELTPVEKEWLRYRLSHQGPSAVKRFLRNLKQARWGMTIRAIEFRKEVERFEFVLDYLHHAAQPFLLHRKVPREDVIRGLGIAPDELAGSLGHRDLAKLSEQDFVKRVVVEAMRKRLLREMRQPTHPLYRFLQQASLHGIEDETYFFGLLSPIHSPYYAHHNEFNRELSYLPSEDLMAFAAVAETHRTQGAADGARARDGGNHRVREETGRNIGTRKFTAPSHGILIPLHSP